MAQSKVRSKARREAYHDMERTERRLIVVEQEHIIQIIIYKYLTPVGFPLSRYSHRAPREGRSHWHGGSHHLSVGQGSHNLAVGQGSHNLSVGQVEKTNAITKENDKRN